MPQSARAWIVGAIGIGVLVLALVWMLGDGASPGPEADAEPETSEPARLDRAEPLPPASLETGPRTMSPEAARELAGHLARAFDGGVRRPVPGASAGVDPSQAAPEPVPPPPPRTTLRIERPLAASERVDYASRLHDGIVLRRDELRRRLAELERTGQGDSAQAGRVRWEIARLDQTEPTARARVEELAEEAREEASEEAPVEARQAPPAP